VRFIVALPFAISWLQRRVPRALIAAALADFSRQFASLRAGDARRVIVLT
jgi:hypothetical protein